MIVKLKKSEIGFITFSLLLLVITWCGIISYYRVNIYLLVILFIWAFILTLQEKSFSIFQVFLFTYFFFLLSRIFLDAIGIIDMRTLGLYRRAMMSNDQANEVLSILIVYLIGSVYAWLITKHREREDINTFDKKIEPLSFNNPLKILFYIYFVLFCVKLAYIAREVMRHGYLVIFDGSISSMHFPIILTGAAIITEGLFIILMYYNRDERSFKVLCGLMLFAGIVKSFTGQRGYILVFLLFVIYLWATHYKPIKIFSFKIVLLIIIIPLLIQVTWNYRYHVEDSFSDLISQNVYVRVLDTQGASLEVVGDMVEFNDTFYNEVPFFLGYIVDSFKSEPAGQVYEDIAEGNYLGDHLTYKLSQGTFYAGHGTGSSIVAEAYDLFNGNRILITIFGFIITCLAIIFSGRIYKSPYWFALSYYYLTDYIFSPRSSVLKSLGDLYVVIIMCILVHTLNKYIISKQAGN